MTIGITGASGFLAQGLASFLEQSGQSLWRYSRGPARAQGHWLQQSPADALPCPPPRDGAAGGLDALVHLAGESLLGLWTAAKRRRMVESRVEGTRRVIEAMARWPQELRPKVLVCASGAGFYGDRGEQWLTEDSARGEGFLADLCEQWEQAAQQATALGMRVVQLRLGMVLGREGGALPLMRLLWRLGLGGVWGDGQQWQPWIAQQDVQRLIWHALQTPTLQGPLNACAPGLLRHGEFARGLGQALHRPTLWRLPKLLAQNLGGAQVREMMLCSARVQPAAALASGFVFAQPQLAQALEDLLAPC